MDSGYLDIFILAIVAVIVIYKFFTILGKDVGYKSDSQKKDIDNLILSPLGKDENPSQDHKEMQVIATSREQKKKALYDHDFYKSDIGIQCENIYGHKDFSAYDFINSAKQVFEMVNEAFANSDFETLEMLLTEKIYKEYQEDIENYKQNKEHIYYVFIGFDDISIDSIVLQESKVSIFVTFVTRQVFAITDEHGDVVDGDKEKTKKIKDTWTFERALDSSSPVWLVSQTYVD